MSMFQNPNPQNLDEWLEMATKKLVFAARQRIWAEVTSHYEEAVEGHLQNGLPLALAQEASLAELGDAKAAGRRFRRTHLTLLEFRKVHGLLSSYQPSLWVHVCGFLGCWWLALGLGRLRFSVFSVIGVVSLFIVYETVAFVLTRHKTPRRVVQMEMGGWIILGLVLAGMFPPLPLRGWPGLFFLLVFLNAIGNILYYFRLGNKLGKAGEEWKGESVAAWNEIPPDKPVAS